MLFGPRITTVFRSRWRAAAWSAMVLVSVYFYVRPKENGETEAGEAAAMVGAVAPGASQSADSAVPANPWAPDRAAH